MLFEYLAGTLARNDQVAVEQLLVMKEDMLPGDWEEFLSTVGVTRPWLLYRINPSKLRILTWEEESDDGFPF